MIKTFKTKQPVLVNPLTQDTAEVFLDVQETNFNGLAYYGLTEYYYFKDGSRIVIPSKQPTFTVEEANAIEQAYGGLTGTTLTEKFIDLITKASMYQFTAGGYFTLTGDDWEIYEEPIA